MPQAQGLTGLAEQMAAVAGAIVGHDPPDGDALSGEPDDGPGKEAGAAIAGLVLPHLDVGGAGTVVDADVDVFPAGAVVLPASGGGDAMAGLVELGSFLMSR